MMKMLRYRLLLLLVACALGAPPSPAQTRQGAAPLLVPPAPLLTLGAPYEPTALPCSINAACPEGDGWEAEATATVRVLVGGGSCTGVLLNNVRQDGRPYVLTAQHCASGAVGEVVDWGFEFGYASPTCADPAEVPTPVRLTGGRIRATAPYPFDFTLVELSEPFPNDFAPVFAGWSIDDEAPATGTVISHPRGDLKKLAFDDAPLIPYGSYWMGTFDRGTIEIGSSGAPLFNEHHEFIGHVRSAIVIDHEVCSGPGGDDNRAMVLFPRLALLWEHGLGAVLDPDGTGTRRLPALGAPPAVWIHEVNADTRPGNGHEPDEFVELAGLPGLDLGGYTLDVYACEDGEARPGASFTLDPFVLPAWREDRGFFVIGGPAVPAQVRDQRFPKPKRFAQPGGLLPDDAGLLILNDPDGRPVFDYQYGADGACPATYHIRSIADAPGAGTMGFPAAERPMPSSAGTAALRASPGQPNITAPARREAAPLLRPTAALDAYPNPFNPATRLTLRLDRRQHVRVVVFDLTGRRVAHLFDGLLEAGEAHRFAFDAATLPSGVYLVRAIGEDFVAAQPVTLLK